MPQLSYARYRDEIVAQTRLLEALLPSADLRVPVPSCPGWDVHRLVRHLGGVQRWATEVITVRATGPVDDSAYRQGDEAADLPAAALAEWLGVGADALAGALAGNAADTPVWTPVESGAMLFYARRFTHEAALHRADATLALGVDYRIEPDVATDALDEWMELGALPFHFEVHPWMRELLGPGRTLRFEATDADQRWFLDLTGELIRWSHADEPAAVTVSGPVRDLLLAIYRRSSVKDLTVEGDADLLDFWLERVAFG